MTDLALASLVHERVKWWPEVGSYLDRLVSEGVLEQWEVADPDQYAADHGDDNEGAETELKVLVHPLAVDGAEGRYIN